MTSRSEIVGAANRPDEHIDKAAARRAFDRAAPTYDAAAVLQREIGRRMLERLDYVRLEPRTVLDLGCGTGDALDHLARRYRKARLVGLDFAPGMLRRARRRGGWLRRPHAVCADAERLPLATASVDLIVSNATIQWCNDLDATFGEVRRVLRPGGLLLFTTFGPDTLHELRAAWAAADATPHVGRFLDMHLVGDALVRSGLADPVMDTERITLTYEHVRALMRDLKDIGAHNAERDRSRGLTGPGRLRVMEQAYERFRRDGRLPATYEVVHGHAWAPATQPQRRTVDGVEVPVYVLRRRGWGRLPVTGNR